AKDSNLENSHIGSDEPAQIALVYVEVMLPLPDSPARLALEVTPERALSAIRGGMFSFWRVGRPFACPCAAAHGVRARARRTPEIQGIAKEAGDQPAQGSKAPGQPIGSHGARIPSRPALASKTPQYNDAAPATAASIFGHPPKGRN